MTSPEEYYKKHYKPNDYRWETSGIHAYNVLLKYAAKNTQLKGGKVTGMSREDVACAVCGKIIKRGHPVTKYGETPVHKKCDKQ